MTVNDKLVQMIKRDEGHVTEGGRHVAYTDHLGYLTIGYGRLIDRQRGGGLTDQEAEYLLMNDIHRVHDSLKSRVSFFSSLTENRKHALINMGFQLGINGVLQFRRMLSAMQRGDFVAAEKEALDSRWARQTPQRARRVAAMIREG